MYNLRGRDPEGGRVKYTISGDFFSVDGESGAVRLREPLDREAAETIDVVITIQDAAFNLIPFRREIRGKFNSNNSLSLMNIHRRQSITAMSLTPEKIRITRQKLNTFTVIMK